MADIPDNKVQKSTVPAVDAGSLLVLWSQWLKADLADILTPNGAFRPINEWPLVWRQLVHPVETKELFERSKDGGDASWDRVGQTVKVKWISAKEISELIAKHKAVDAFVAQQKQGDVNFMFVTAEPAREVSAARKRLEALQQGRQVIELEPSSLIEEKAEEGSL